MPHSRSPDWQGFCARGQISVGHQRRSLEACTDQDGIVRGYYSDIELDPTLPSSHSLYPSHDHTTVPRNDREMVVEARVFNDMKAHLTASEFWEVIEHFYAVGRAKGRIPDRSPQRLHPGWTPERGY